jgi:hypothetical protein
MSWIRRLSAAKPTVRKAEAMPFATLATEQLTSYGGEILSVACVKRSRKLLASARGLPELGIAWNRSFVIPGSVKSLHVQRG